MDWLEKGDLDMKMNDDEGVATYSSIEQEGVEHNVIKRFKDFEELSDIQPEVLLNRDRHIEYLLKGLDMLPRSYDCLDASRPWLCYWIVHSLTLLEQELPDDVKSRICKFLARCQNATGGFGGGPGQASHLAPTYAAVNCLCCLQTEEAYNVINRNTLLEFLRRMRQADGSFTMHEDGECDTRSVYCAVSAASLTGLLNEDLELFNNSVQWLVRCQTYEGGMGGCPGAEAHGGYTFCGYAALVLLDHYKLVDTDRMLRWVCNKQMKMEGGFQGRTNKLVDACYSFWQGGLLPLIHNTLEEEGGVEGEIAEAQETWLYDQKALQCYVLHCCQSSFGGLIDKPGKSRDYYHTCYALSGLSSSQHCPNNHQIHIGPRSNILLPVHPAFNLTYDSVRKAMRHFNKMSLENQ